MSRSIGSNRIVLLYQVFFNKVDVFMSLFFPISGAQWRNEKKTINQIEIKSTKRGGQLCERFMWGWWGIFSKTVVFRPIELWLVGNAAKISVYWGRWVRKLIPWEVNEQLAFFSWVSQVVWEVCMGLVLEVFFQGRLYCVSMHMFSVLFSFLLMSRSWLCRSHIIIKEET